MTDETIAYIDPARVDRLREGWSAVVYGPMAVEYAGTRGIPAELAPLRLANEVPRIVAKAVHGMRLCAKHGKPIGAETVEAWAAEIMSAFGEEEHYTLTDLGRAYVAALKGGE